MHDIRYIREHPQDFDACLRRRGLPGFSSRILELDRRKRAALHVAQEARTKRNMLAKEAARCRTAEGRGTAQESADSADVLHKSESRALRARIECKEKEAQQAEAVLHDVLISLPNLPLSSIPDGDESFNRVVREVGRRGVFSFPAQEHSVLGEGLGLLDFALASRISGSRFSILRGSLARLHRALGQFMLDLHTSAHGYCEIAPPLLVREDTLVGTGQLPKFGADQFQTTDGRWLIPTSEAPLVNLGRDTTIPATDLPWRFVACTPCFRSEAGAAGKDTRGMLRQHQFEKVELVSLVHPRESEGELERMTHCAEEVLRQLQLPYRVVCLSCGDIGFAAAKTYDLEVWLPGQGNYREISSCSNCLDFQARRIQARFRESPAGRPSLVHTLNGSGVAVGRALIAVMENFQDARGDITIPSVLQPYMKGQERISCVEDTSK